MLSQAAQLADAHGASRAVTTACAVCRCAATDRIAVESTFAKADANGDGRITREEATALPAIAARFDQLDRNKDGVLSLEEFGAGYAATD